ncbi:acetylornithine deacetylase or succinyl-diaminopimelate desuccinylase [Neobacillus bataviensis LMG 21833]|uniref:Acetylornithine deacetylase or succinyl-diaminopimelate desuccinylase n=1 Tax=Neobacillus bataviensis LMG 21833 TaxID=1117379 RepID=K6DEN6_9BACI|nr:M20 family metallopeptidase [Neobacillus bataviensis]EKN70982.1 acetylornithine deacetylase or succinyl-diaminopimelate desuccinylase [Neobacillus bataviensis LMG 21833]
MQVLHSIFETINEKEAIQFLQSLIQVNSVNQPGNEKRVAEVIKTYLASSNLHVELDDLGNNRANIFVTYPNVASDEKYLVYSGHLDTVPTGKVEWEHDPFSGKVVGNKVYGRGTTDMKGGVAAMILALKYLEHAGVKLKGKVQFVGTAGEEVDGYGAKKVVEKGQIDKATALVISEPSENQLFTAHKGCLWLEITTNGKTAHGSMPDQGINAILTMNEFINTLQTYQFDYTPHTLLGHPTINIGTIEGGVKTNVVPDQCKLTLDIRTIPGQDKDKILKDIENMIQESSVRSQSTYQIKVINSMESVGTNESDDFVKLAVNTAKNHFNTELIPSGVNYYTDASVYCPHLQIPTIIVGPGNPKLAHQPDEYIEIDKFIESIRYFMALAIDYLGVS